MRMTNGLLLGAVLALSAPARSAGPDPASADVARVLDDWHDAAAKADEARYFGHFAKDAVFMGTDATERWSAEAFRVWSKKYFDRGKAWSFKPKDRFVSFSKDRSTAWFDEMLDTPNLGLCRGSGVLTKDAKGWKIAQYNLSIPIPNDLATQVVKLVGASASPTVTPSTTPAHP